MDLNKRLPNMEGGGIKADVCVCVWGGGGGKEKETHVAETEGVIHEITRNASFVIFLLA